MKNRKIRRHISMVLSVVMLLQMFVVPQFGDWGITAKAAETNDLVSFEDDFEYDAIDYLIASAQWEVESRNYTGTKPEIVDGIIKMTTGDSIQFDWTQVSDIGEFDATKTYTFEFDTKVTDAVGLNKSDDKTRALYVAPGGWYNQIEINNRDSKIRAGGTYIEYDSTKFTNQTVHVKLEWCGNTITSTITDQTENILVTGSRTSDDYNYATSAKDLMTFLAIRCEDGAVEIDNFSFTDGTVSYNQTFDNELDFEYDDIDDLIASAQWEVEATNEYTGTKPEIVDGVIKMTTGDSIQFDWTQVSDIGEFDATKTYTFEFDAKVTDAVGLNKSDDKTRALYVAPGGYYNQIEINNKDSKIRAGGTYIEYDSTKFTNQTVHVKLEWCGNTITSTITDQTENILVTGSRTSDDYNYATSAKDLMTFLAIRCEDGAVEIDNFSFTDGTVSYNQTFNNFGASPIGVMFLQNVWEVEATNEYTGTQPEIVNGVIKMDTKDSVQFNWTNVADVGSYDTTMTYTFEFDAKVTDAVGLNKNEDKTRALYVAPGGYYNQVEINDNSGRVRAGGTYITYDDNVFTNQTVHIKLDWCGTTITSTITDITGNILAEGTRTSSAYDYASLQDERMKYLVLRCEDGAVEIDNFKFTKRQVELEQSVTEINIPTDKQAIYESRITYAKGSLIKLEMSGTNSSEASVTGELFRISDIGMFIGGYTCAGTFNEGEYGIKIFLNPIQEAVLVEVTLPDGGVIRRGSFSLLYGCTSVTQMVAGWSDTTDPVTNEQVTYEDMNQTICEVNNSEPVYEGFNANVYNLVTSFDGDAKTTRTFAWTALETFVGTDTMSVQYRKKDADVWQSVDAVKETEKTEEETEDYFKADVTGLTAGTTYEYRIGKKDSTDETNDWGAIYTFTTETETVDEFSFIAVGDTQAEGWTGRGYMYAQAALNQAVSENGSPAFVLNTGDVADYGSNLSQWNWYFKALGDIGKSIPHFAAIGNHDTYGASDNFDLHFNHPNNGGSAAFAEGTSESVSALNNSNWNNLMNNLDETTYSFNYGKAHFVVLNTGAYASVDQIVIEGQREWLKADLEQNADAEWTIIIGHQPVYHRKGGGESRPWLYDIIEEYGVDLVLHGHSHLVTRTYPMKNGEVVSNSITDTINKGTGTVYSTVGSTTTNHDGLSGDIQENMYTVFTTKPEQPTYTAVTVKDSAITLTIKQINGLVVDEFTILSSDEEVNKFSGATLELGGKIGFNFYVNKNHTLSDEAYVEFELPKADKQTVKLEKAVETGKGLKFTCLVPAKEMADTVTATLYDGEQELDVQSISIRDYAEAIIENKYNLQDYAEATPLMKSMLHYGAYSQNLFTYNTEDLANKNYTADDKVQEVTVEDLVSYTKGYQGLSGFGRLAGATLVLEGETTLRMFFEFEDSANVEGLKFIVNGTEKSFTKSGNYYIVECENIGAKDLDLENQVVVMIGEETKFVANCSAMTFCYNALKNSSTSEELQNVAKALYLYNDAANLYMGEEISGTYCGFTVQDGRLVPPGATGEGKAILKESISGCKTVSVDIYPGESNIINSGIYLGASEAADVQDSINALSVIVQSDFAATDTWTDAPNRIDLIIGSFPSWTEHYRLVSETGANNALFTNGEKQPLNLKVDIEGNKITVTLSLVNEPTKSVTAEYTYTGEYDLAAGQVGIRSQYDDSSFDNFKVVTSHNEMIYGFSGVSAMSVFDFYHSTWIDE